MNVEEENRSTMKRFEDNYEETTGSNLDIIEVISNEEEQTHQHSTMIQSKSIDDYIEMFNEDEEIHDLTTKVEDCSNEVDIVSGSLLGMTRDTLDEMYELYCKHARALGFSVRKSTSRYSRDPIPIELAKMFVCSCNGQKRSKSDCSRMDAATTKKGTAVTRTNCGAMMRAKKNQDGVYEVVKHEVEHNHAMTRTEWSHLHRSERKITNEKARAIEDMTHSGMRATESFRFLAHTVAGEENIGHTIKDHINFVARLKSKKIEGGDAETLIKMMDDEDSEEDDFFYRMKTDSEGRLANIFWRNSMMKEDYEIYGDVVVFDTTYRTNRYNLICAPFVGVNNHWRNTMFGCAFIADERAETFEWLFKMFKKSMGGKSPVTIFTDQDLAIANAIEKIFPESRHRLCLWHIHQNAASRFGELKSDSTFKNTFNKCLSGCDNEEEFESCWRAMVVDYKLENNNWFTRLYSLKQKWCTALNKGFFSAGFRSSQRSESTNHAIGFNANQTTSLTDFYGIFKDTIKRWRRAEQKDEFNCSRGRPESSFGMAGIVSHAAEVYTFELFGEFQKEFMKCISDSSTIIGDYDTTIIYTVTSFKGDNTNRVIFDKSFNRITCDCMKFEEYGMLCHHYLRILLINSVQRIPDAYIMKRWTKIAKSEVWEKFGNEKSNAEKSVSCISWRHEISRTFYNIVLRSEGKEEARRFIEDGCRGFSRTLDEMTSTERVTTSNNSGTSRTILDPAHSTTKGRGKRIKGHLEKNKKKKVCRSHSDKSKEYGSITPIS